MRGLRTLLGLVCLTLHSLRVTAGGKPLDSAFPDLVDLAVALIQVQVSVSPGPCKLCKKPVGANRSAKLLELPASPSRAATDALATQSNSSISSSSSSSSVLVPGTNSSAILDGGEPIAAKMVGAADMQAIPWFRSSPSLNGVEQAVEEHLSGGRQTSGGRHHHGAAVWIAIAAAIFIGLVVLPLLAVATWILSKKGFRRQAHFWWYAYPIYRDYISVLRKLPKGASEEEVEQAFEGLHVKYAPVVLDLILDMGGMFIKIAQGLSTMPDSIPQVYREQFAKCASQCTAMGFQEVKAVVGAELSGIRSRRDLCGLCFPGSGAEAFDETFSSFDEKPLGAASIGQVHRARLRGPDGKEIVVKVQRPGAREIFQADINCLTTLVRWAEREGAQSWGIMAAEELDKQIQQEFDYLQEARNVDAMREVLLPHFADRVVVPEVVHELTSERMLAMTFLEGQGLDKAFRAKVAATGVDASKVLKFMSMLGDGDEAGDGEAVEAASGREESSGGTGIGTHGAAAPPKEAGGQGDAAAVDYKAVMDTLIEVYGYCFLAKGVYNADPHPGNVLLMPDGRLGLVDFGQVKYMHEESRIALANVIAGILDGDQRRTVDAMTRIGFNYISADENVIHDDICWHQALWLWGKMAIIPFPKNIKKTEVVRDSAKDMPMVVRTVLILRGVALAFGSWVSIAEAWLPFAAASPEEAERLTATVKELEKKNLSGTWTMTCQATGEEVAWVFKHPPGQQFFFATRGGSRQAAPNGHIRGRSIEWKCAASGRLWRGSLDNDGEHLSQVQCFAPDEKYLGVHRGVLASGKVGRSVNSAKAVSSTLCFAFTAARLARKKKS